jgi:hypothetical protein
MILRVDLVGSTREVETPLPSNSPHDHLIPRVVHSTLVSLPLSALLSAWPGAGARCVRVRGAGGGAQDGAALHALRHGHGGGGGRGRPHRAPGLLRTCPSGGAPSLRLEGLG